jgi:uncharacterized membrane protein
MCVIIHAKVKVLHLIMAPLCIIVFVCIYRYLSTVKPLHELNLFLKVIRKLKLFSA